MVELPRLGPRLDDDGRQGKVDESPLSMFWSVCGASWFDVAYKKMASQRLIHGSGDDLHRTHRSTREEHLNASR